MGAPGSVGSLITKRRLDFDSRSDGYRKFSDILAATILFDRERRALITNRQMRRPSGPLYRTGTAAAAWTAC